MDERIAVQCMHCFCRPDLVAKVPASFVRIYKSLLGFSLVEGADSGGVFLKEALRFAALVDVYTTTCDGALRWEEGITKERLVKGFERKEKPVTNS